MRALADVQAGLAALAETGRVLAARLDAQTAALTRTLELCTATRAGTEPSPSGRGTGSGVLGGTVDPSRLPARWPDGRVRGAEVEVRCVWDGGWAGGFEVVEVLECRDGVRFRLLRRSDRSVLPVLFDDHEVRASPSAPPAPAPVGVIDLTDPALADPGFAGSGGGATRPDGAPTTETGPPGAPSALW